MRRNSSLFLLFKKNKQVFHLYSVLFIFIFLFTNFTPASFVYAQDTFSNKDGSVAALPPPGARISHNRFYAPAAIRGLTIYPYEPFRFDFLIDVAEDHFSDEGLQEKSMQLVKYFLAALTVPSKQQWVNLSPHEKNRIIPESLAQTSLGIDLLSQDYILKQLTASLMYPEQEPGKQFWEKIYSKVSEKYGSLDIPLETFHKVWIVPDKAVVFRNNNHVFIVESHLRVMLEQDYISLRAANDPAGSGESLKATSVEESALTTQMMKEIILPEIENEINQGEWFAPLRQIYNSVILAAWYKNNLRQSLFAQIIADQNKTGGSDRSDPEVVQQIYEQYMSAFQKGVFDYIKEDYDIAQKEIVPRHYFSGGVTLLDVIPKEWDGPIKSLPSQRRAAVEASQKGIQGVNVEVVMDMASEIDTISQSLQEITQKPIHPSGDQAAQTIVEEVNELIDRSKELGIDINALPPLASAHAGIVFNDKGFFLSLNGESPQFYPLDLTTASMDSIQSQITIAVKNLAAERKAKIVSAGIVNLDPERVSTLGSYLWMDLDINWFNLAAEKIDGFSEMEDSAKAMVAAQISASSYKREGSFEDYKVQIDPETNLVQEDPLLSLQKYKDIVSPEEWEEFQYWVSKIKDKVTMVFLNSTAQGGGVALMRHSNLRILHENGVDARWFVMGQAQQTKEKSFFDVTKQSFHNTFQGRASKRIEEGDKEILEEGWKQQLPKFEKIFKTAKDTVVVIVDDYQPSGMIEGIEKLGDKYNKKIEFLYRSHIHFEADMSEGTDARTNWDFLWNKIRSHVKIAIIHPTDPIEESVPPNVAEEVATVVMNPSTDVIDGLNKLLPADILLDYLLRFNEFLPMQNKDILAFLQKEPDKIKEWFGKREIHIQSDLLTVLDLKRPYVIQVARFDPSKNIAGALEAFSLFRQELKEKGVPAEKMPQLVLTGHGAIDDPDGMKYLIDTIDRAHNLYPEIAKDIKVARLPHNDQVLNALLRYSFAALQLSVAEGYEIKVSEALQKGIPTIAYNVGGIGRQIIDGVTGYLINPSKEALTKLPRSLAEPLIEAKEELAEQMPALTEVADHLCDLFTQKSLYDQMQNAAYQQVKRDKFSFTHTTRWVALSAVANMISPEELVANQVFREPIDVFLDRMKVSLDGPEAVQSRMVRDNLAREREDVVLSTQEPDAQDLGGIDMNEKYIEFIVKKNDAGIPLPLNLQPNEFYSVDGINPIILNISPVSVSRYLE